MNEVGFIYSMHLKFALRRRYLVSFLRPTSESRLSHETPKDWYLCMTVAVYRRAPPGVNSNWERCIEIRRFTACYAFVYHFLCTWSGFKGNAEGWVCHTNHSVVCMLARQTVKQRFHEVNVFQSCFKLVRCCLLQVSLDVITGRNKLSTGGI